MLLLEEFELLRERLYWIMGAQAALMLLFFGCVSVLAWRTRERGRVARRYPLSTRVKIAFRPERYWRSEVEAEHVACLRGVRPFAVRVGGLCLLFMMSTVVFSSLRESALERIRQIGDEAEALYEPPNLE